MIINKIQTGLNKITPGIKFHKYVKNVLYHGQDCGYVELAGKRKYILYSAMEKLETKLEMNNFKHKKPRMITLKEFNLFKHLLKPIIQNEKGLKNMKINDNLYFSPSPNAIQIIDEKNHKSVVTIIKKLRTPTKEILFHKYPILTKIFRKHGY